MGTKRAIPTVTLEISDILHVTDKRIQVVVKKTGRPLWLPKEPLDYLPGCVVLPAWLARKLDNRIFIGHT